MGVFIEEDSREYFYVVLPTQEGLFTLFIVGALCNLYIFILRTGFWFRLYPFLVIAWLLFFSGRIVASLSLQRSLNDQRLDESTL